MIIKPDWSAPKQISAYCSTRQNGFSQAPYHSLNLGSHVGDNPKNVAKNRDFLQQKLQLPQTPHWLKQTHSSCACDLDQASTAGQYDASYTQKQQTVCAVLTADCLPLLVCNKKGTQIAAIHAGWRGLLNGVIENTLNQAGFIPAQTLVWLGPAISVNAFEVGIDVYQAFCQNEPIYKQAFKTGKDSSHYYADIYLLAKQRLSFWGLEKTAIFGANYCTYQQKELFFSYRRDGQTGRIASLIYIN